MSNLETTTAKVLIANDIHNNFTTLNDALKSKGHRILVASSEDTVYSMAIHELPDLIILDTTASLGLNAYDLCFRLKQHQPTKHIPIIFITVKEEKKDLTKFYQTGGIDCITVPFEEEELILRIENHLKIAHLNQEILQKNNELQKKIEELNNEVTRREEAEKQKEKAFDALQKVDEKLSIIAQKEIPCWGIDGFVGTSKTIKYILDQIYLLQQINTMSVLIIGESGTGKDLIARAIHFWDNKPNGPFIPVNCSAIPKDLVESAFFGHIRGAFSGANNNHKGYFMLADGGTLFLDEICDMPIELQPKLLRVIEDGYIQPVGSDREIRVNVRIMASAKRDLLECIAQGIFREDLYFRLAQFRVKLPPLRERKEDIPLLADHFIRICAADMRIKPPELDTKALHLLDEYHFPGNVRELKSIIGSALLKSGGKTIRPEHLDLTELGNPNIISISNGHKTNNNPDYQPDNHPKNLQYIEQLLIKRAKKSIYKNNGQVGFFTQTDEEKILIYIKEHGSINNNECRNLLFVDPFRASYLLKKMHKYGLLVREGENRWSNYSLPQALSKHAISTLTVC